ncbi:MAG: site-specific integrase [Moraxellaceae bacterium]|nr:site-specific integrase [Moraxellaceae bacterium]
MAKVRARSDNKRLFFDFYYLGERFREQTLLIECPENRRRLERLIKQIDAEITLGTFEYARYFPESKNVLKVAELKALQATYETSRPMLHRISGHPTVREFGKLWLEENEIRWRRATKSFMENHLNGYVMEEFGQKVVSDITRADILAFRTKLAKVQARKAGTTLAPRTINAYMMVLKSLLNEAADRFQFTAPTNRLPNLKIPKTEFEPFSLEEVFKIINAVPEDYRYYVTVRFFTGMRTAEADGLKWSRIDWSRKQIGIVETYSSGKTETTKNEGSQRYIDMNGLVYDALVAQKQRFGSLSAYVFCNSAGGPLDSTNFSKRVWAPTLKKLGLQIRRPYQMRHTAATLWLASGEAPEWIARQMGHTSTQMLFKVYSRYVPNLTRRDGAAFEQMLASNGFIKTIHAPVLGDDA